VWSYDFVSARTVDGGSLRILNVIDENTRVALGPHVARSRRRRVHPAPGEVVRPAREAGVHPCDNGREFIAETVRLWLADQRVRPVYVGTASPQQNCYIERFNGSMRRELLNGEQFHSVLEAKVVIEDWLVLYNTRRAHRGLGGRTPAAYAKMARSQQSNDRPGGGG
jgi:transposase InsO family protein